jgi:diguanylate cyclase (GGDEF)-like protein
MGEKEFIGIVRNVTPDDFRHIGQRLRNMGEASYILFEEKQLHVTIPIGATLATDSESITTLLQRADDLMYQSKSAGKNSLTML